jgi:DNA-binding transcriptional regulator GbsR (MarR family)
MVEKNNLENYLQLHETIARNYGANPTESLIIAVVRANYGPIALEELSSITGYSLATVSNVVRKFESHNILKRTRKPRSKKIFVESKTNYLETMKKKLMLIKINTGLLVENLPKIINDVSDKKKKSLLREELRQAKKSNKIINCALSELDKNL